MNTHAHPTAVYIERKPIIRDRRWSPVLLGRLPVAVNYHTSPRTAVDYSAFHGVGRDITHAVPHNIPPYQALAIADKLSIAAWPANIVRKVPGAMVVPGSRVGGMQPVTDRGMVLNRDTESLSARGAIQPPATFASKYAKIM